MAKRRRSGKRRQVSPLTPRPKLNGLQNFSRDLVAEELNYTVICRRVFKCEPLFRFNPLNLAKIVCFAKWVKRAKCVSSDFLNEKVLMILTYIILKIIKGSIKISSKFEALGRTLLSGAILTKFAYFTSISGPPLAPKENS